MGYWQERVGLEYYAIVRQWLCSLGQQESIVDIGCADTPVASWGNFKKRWTIDKYERSEIEGVQKIIGSWPDCAILIQSVDVITCLQVLEHLLDPEPFCQSLFTTAKRHIILSVPWGWPKGMCESHYQDPVDETKLYSWTHRQPDKMIIADNSSPRCILLYNI